MWGEDEKRKLHETKTLVSRSCHWGESPCYSNLVALGLDTQSRKGD